MLDRCAHYAIYDGHGGQLAAEYAQRHLHSNIMSAGLPRELVCVCLVLLLNALYSVVNTSLCYYSTIIFASICGVVNKFKSSNDDIPVEIIMILICFLLCNHYTDCSWM